MCQKQLIPSAECLLGMNVPFYLVFLQGYTGGITQFSAKENFRKILKVSHFSLEFSLDEKCNKINIFS